MAFVRRNVWDLGDDWAPEILWYARGVGAMQKLPLANKNSWRFWGGIHGYDQKDWTQLGQHKKDGAMPPADVLARYWSQCQHASWYFLPWHRGYLIAFEAQVRAAIKALGGPADTWALPYWNYFKRGQNPLPKAFATLDWPDGNVDNPLFTTARYGPQSDGKVYVDLQRVSLDALTQDPDFAGDVSATLPGFGGPITGFEHGDHGSGPGALELDPHGGVHVLVGGGDRKAKLSMMAHPDNAGLDPIFWLHHCNIDRLWDVWAATAGNAGSPKDPNDATDKSWLDGPTGRDRRFVLPMPDGTDWSYAPAEMTETANLGYSYDDVTPAKALPAVVKRLQNFGLELDAASALVREVGGVAKPKKAELMGASDGGFALVGDTAQAAVTLKSRVQSKFSASLVAPFAERLPDRVFLSLENVTGLNDATIFDVYVNLPEDADPEKFPALKAGSIALFGVRKASQADGRHAGEGLTFSLDISEMLDRLHLDHDVAPDELRVSLHATAPVEEESKIHIGRIGIYRQGA